MTSPATSTSTVVVLPCVDGLGSLSDAQLLELQRESGAARRQVDAVVAAISGEVARRSSRELGHAGLAARTGAASPEKAVQALTGVSLPEARALVGAGTALGGDSPWLTPVAEALEAGELTVASAAAIVTGLGTPTADVAPDDLLDAAGALVDFAVQSTPELTARAARNTREHLDVEHIADIEEHRRSRRCLKMRVLPNGNVAFSGEADPESAAILFGAIDAITSPRRGGPRFHDADPVATAVATAGSVPEALEGALDGALQNDTRTNEQAAFDALIDIVQLGVRAAGSDIDPTHLFGHRSPAVRVHVQASDLKQGKGFAYFEGRPGAAFVSVDTAKRIACDTGWLPVLFDGDTAIDVGRTQRLHTAKQRVALHAHWNGCPVGNCDHPPAMTEIHHRQPWDGSNTTLANGIPLCKFHHLGLHNNKWTIIERDGQLWYEPAPDTVGTPMPIRSRNPLVG